MLVRTNYTLFCGVVILQSPPYILEGEATLNKFINVKCNRMQYLRYCFKGMGHKIGYFEIF